MKLIKNDIFQLENFEGPLDLLWHLVHRQEIDIYEISLRQITQQFLSSYQESETPNISDGAEFIGMAASFIHLKSNTLLPVHEMTTQTIHEEETDPHFEIIHHLLDYCRFKQAAKTLTKREQEQSAFYSRGVDQDTEIKKKLGIDHLSLTDLASLFQEILSKLPAQKTIELEETWRVSDKIKVLRYMLKGEQTVRFDVVFTAAKSREELIVTFLALLELMKMGELKVIRELQQNAILIIGQ